MKHQPLWCVSLATLPEAEDAVAVMLGATLNRAAVTWLNAGTGTSMVSVYCETRPAADVRETIAAGLERIKRCGLKVGRGKMAISNVRREDWAESWKRHFKPIEIGDALLVKPSWSKRRPRKNQAVVILDPGLSFGTGQHPTTAFCLREIVAAACDCRNRRPQSAAPARSFLDIGSGSGILAIAAAKLGYKPVHAFDFDAEAVRNSRTNARANRVQAKIKLGHTDVTRLPARPSQKYDLVCANLVSDLLVAERRRIAALVNRGGTLVLAGILKSEFREVRAAYETLGFKTLSSKTEKEWRSGSFRAV